jgi:hypothetical protein
MRRVGRLRLLARQGAWKTPNPVQRLHRNGVHLSFGGASRRMFRLTMVATFVLGLSFFGLFSILAPMSLFYS